MFTPFPQGAFASTLPPAGPPTTQPEPLRHMLFGSPPSFKPPSGSFTSLATPNPTTGASPYPPGAPTKSWRYSPDELRSAKQYSIYPKKASLHTGSEATNKCLQAQSTNAIRQPIRQTAAAAFRVGRFRSLFLTPPAFSYS